MRLRSRRVTNDGFVSFDGVLYGVPSSAHAAGRVVQVGVRHGDVLIWSNGQEIARHPMRLRSGTQVQHPTQFAGILPASTHAPSPTPIGHQVTAPLPVRRSLAEYDQIYGIIAEVGA
ncbi:Mu transposase domain-containing protein [Herpetosiphon geysericola]|uniref:Mu transposase domain-containing protein n=1 Tax=Herpetosiphon geysericola TaxID=70996 RepID=UPI001F43B8CD|nr:hypothetical protein [Herpetosiphon geysericola]